MDHRSPLGWRRQGRLAHRVRGRPSPGRTGTRMRIATIGIAAVSLALVATACSSGNAGSATGGPTPPTAADTRFAQPGPDAAGPAPGVKAHRGPPHLCDPGDQA